MNARQIDELLGVPARLSIVATLAQVASLAFSELGRETGLADGNLHVQTRKLLAAGYIAGAKGRKGNRRVTCFSLTGLGREKLAEYVRMLARAAGMRGFSSGQEPVRTRNTNLKTKDESQVW